MGDDEVDDALGDGALRLRGGGTDVLCGDDVAMRSESGLPVVGRGRGLVGEDVDGRADVYSVGALLHAAATGQSPVDARDWSGVSPRLRAIGERALASDPKDRFPDARALLAELRAASAARKSAAPREGDALS